MTRVSPQVAQAGAIFVICLLCLAGPMMPFTWTGNEINYFDLAYRQTRPELFGEHHAIFDSSNARFFSFWIIGTGVDLLGFDGAKTCFALLALLFLSWALTRLSLALCLAPLAVAAALLIYLNQQSLLGREWLFGTIEAKVFAYICVFFAIAAAIDKRWKIALVLAAIGTAFHFLVGGFWGAAILFLHALETRKPKDSLMLFALFSLLLLPIVTLIAMERLNAEVDLSNLSLSLAQIYAEYRSPHHVAPYSSGLFGFATEWLPGLLAHAGLALGLFFMRKEFANHTQFAVWVAGLNAYIVIAMFVAFVDQSTHSLAALYVFRPSGLILLLSILLLVHLCVVKIGPLDKLTLPVGLIIAALILPNAVLNTYRLLVWDNIGQRLEVAMTAPEKNILEWLQQNTTRKDVVLVQPLGQQGNLLEGSAFPAGLERLTPAAYYVNFKFVPTAPADLADWFRRLQTRSAIFEGDCAALAEVAFVTYLIQRRDMTQMPQHCIEKVYENEDFIISKPI